ncbi:MAG: hypothetical protein WBB73_04110 [Candidatus Aminicenantaceae bacterium]
MTEILMVGAVFMSAAAATRGVCPDPANPKCDPIRGKTAAIIIGILVALFFYFFVLEKGKITDCCYYLAMLASSYLVGNFYRMFKKE